MVSFIDTDLLMKLIKFFIYHKIHRKNLNETRRNDLINKIRHKRNFRFGKLP